MEMFTNNTVPAETKEACAIETMRYMLQTYSLDKHISFMVTFEGNRATLSLLEKLNFEAKYGLNQMVESAYNFVKKNKE